MSTSLFAECRWDTITTKPVLWPVLCEPTFTDFKSVTNLHCFGFQSNKSVFRAYHHLHEKIPLVKLIDIRYFDNLGKDEILKLTHFVTELWIDRNRISNFSMISSSNRCCLCKFIWKLFPHCYFDEPRDNELWMKTIFPRNWAHMIDLSTNLFLTKWMHLFLRSNRILTPKQSCG